MIRVSLDLFPDNLPEDATPPAILATAVQSILNDLGHGQLVYDVAEVDERGRFGPPAEARLPEGFSPALPRDLLAYAAAHHWADQQAAHAEEQEDYDPEDREPAPAVVYATAADPDDPGGTLTVQIGRTCDRDHMAGSLCSRFVDADGHHDGPCD